MWRLHHRTQIFLVTVFGYHLPARCVFPLTQTCEFICVQQPIIKYRSSDFVTCTWHTYMEYLTDQFMLCVTDVREGIKLGVVSSLWCQVSKFCEVFLSCDGKLGLQLNSKWLKVRAWLCYWNLNLLCIPNDMRLIYRSQHKKMGLTFLSSVCFTSCLYGRLSSTQPRRSMRRSRRECLISTMRWDTVFLLCWVFFPPWAAFSLLCSSLSFPSSSSVWFCSSVCGLPCSLSFKKKGKKALHSASFDCSQAKLPVFLLSSALFSTHTLFTS